MSTLRGEAHTQPLRSEEDLHHYFESFAKPRKDFLVGLEAEFLGIDHVTGKALHYEGKNGIHEVMKFLAASFGYEPLYDGKNIIALSRGKALISLEPGGQIELSAPPVLDVFDIERQIGIFLNELRTVERQMQGVRWLAYGIQPFSSLAEITWVPKTRYKIMADHLGRNGTLSHEMMKRTATNQLNVDFESEEDAMASLRTALGITSVVSALFANSSFSDGRPNGFKSYRMEIWNHTDPARTGLIMEFTRPGKTFRDYLEYILEMPMIFIVRDNRWVPVKERTFRQFIREGYGGAHATLGDFELHLSVAFPEARIKQFLEVRGVDGQSPDLIPAVAAFWKGILYDETAREEAWKLVSFASEEQRLQLHHEMPRLGLKAELGGKPIFPIAKQLVELACLGLAKQCTSECVFLERIREKIIKPEKSPAETLIQKWEGEFAQIPSQLMNYLEI